jgi:hypothetical protein
MGCNYHTPKDTYLIIFVLDFLSLVLALIQIYQNNHKKHMFINIYFVKNEVFSKIMLNCMSIFFKNINFIYLFILRQSPE